MNDDNEVWEYHFIELATEKTLGIIRVLAENVDKRGDVKGAWTSTKEFADILAGGIEGGLELMFPDQGAAQFSTGFIEDSACFESLDGAAYGSLDGKTLNLGCINGMVSGFNNDNRLMVLTFTPYGVGYPSYGSSLTTMLGTYTEEDVRGGTGIIQRSSNHDVHEDKYIYFGNWVRKHQPSK